MEKIERKNIKNLGLKRYLFDIEPPPDRVDYWAENERLLIELTTNMKNIMQDDKTSFYIYWGPFGSGKSHAIEYFKNNKIQETLLEIIKKDNEEFVLGKYLFLRFRLSLSSKRGAVTPFLIKELINELCKNMEKENLTNLREIVKPEADRGDIICGTIYKILQKTDLRILGDIPSKKIVSQFLESDKFPFLYGEKVRGLGVLNTSYEFARVITYLVRALLKTYKKIIVSIDEAEYLKEMAIGDIRLFNSLLLDVHSQIPKGLTIILSFSEHAFEEVKNKILPKTMERVYDKIYFDLMDSEERIKKYCEEIFLACGKDIYEIIKKEDLDYFISLVKEDPDFKKYNGITQRYINNKFDRIFSTLSKEQKMIDRNVVDIAFGRQPVSPDYKSEEIEILKSKGRM